MKKYCHPGAYLKEHYLDNLQYTQCSLAKLLGVSTSALCRVISGKSEMSISLALKLEKVLGVSAEFWLELQVKYSLQEFKASKGHAGSKV